MWGFEKFHQFHAVKTYVFPILSLMFSTTEVQLSNHIMTLISIVFLIIGS